MHAARDFQTPLDVEYIRCASKPHVRYELLITSSLFIFLFFTFSPSLAMFANFRQVGSRASDSSIRRISPSQRTAPSVGSGMSSGGSSAGVSNDEEGAGEAEEGASSSERGPTESQDVTPEAEQTGARSLSPSLLPPPSTQPRSRRSFDDENDEVIDTARERKRLRIICASLAEEFKLPVEPIVKFADIVSVFILCSASSNLTTQQMGFRTMLITMYSKILALEVAKSADALESLLISEPFSVCKFLVFVIPALNIHLQIGLHKRLLTAFLAPKLNAYVKHFADNMMDFIRNNGDVFKVPAQVFEDPDLVDLLQNLVSELCIKIRGSIKYKLVVSLNKAQPLSTLLRSIVGRTSIEVTMDIWLRFAFLVSKIDKLCIPITDVFVATMCCCLREHYEATLHHQVQDL